MQYFKLVMANEERWTLAIARQFPDGREVDIWAYSMGQPAADDTVPFVVDVDGEIVDYNVTAFGSIVVSSKMAEILCRIASTEIQRIPAAVRGADGDWEVLNVVSVVDCIDHDRSRIQYFPLDHAEKPAKPRAIIKLVLDLDRAKGHHVFKPMDWLVATIVSADVKAALEDAGITGVEYWPTTDDVTV